MGNGHQHIGKEGWLRFWVNEALGGYMGKMGNGKWWLGGYFGWLTEDGLWGKEEVPFNILGGFGGNLRGWPVILVGGLCSRQSSISPSSVACEFGHLAPFGLGWVEFRQFSTFLCFKSKNEN
jgi:hypothetical protein